MQSPHLLQSPQVMQGPHLLQSPHLLRSWRFLLVCVAAVVALGLTPRFALDAQATAPGLTLQRPLLAQKEAPGLTPRPPHLALPFAPGEGVGGEVSSPVPVLAYYYIWFDPGSWDRAKTDYPQLGRYSSDDEKVMTQHVLWAKAAGIEGFIVGWKSTPKLNDRLAKLITISEAENFKLVIIYQALDFDREPLPISQVDADMGFLARSYLRRSPFSLFDKPVVIWSGTWKYSRDEVALVSRHWRDQVFILATEKNKQDYSRIADLVDGDAYYWSSVNPETNAGYQSKLDGMAKAIHDRQGLWIAPAAPGFDARLVGGTSVVDRQDGAVFRQQMSNALQASADAIGIISWNEFSENTYIEPSQKYGTRYLDILAGVLNVPAPNIPDFDSSEPAGTDAWLGLDRLSALAGVGIVLLASLAILLRRRAALR